jgi:hypothetical protein
LFVIVLFSFPLAAQTKIDSTASNKPDTTKFVMQKSATGAMIRSALIPGWGQLYNQSYWKIPVVWGFFGYFAYVAIYYNNQYKDYTTLTDKAVAENWANKDNYKKVRDQYRDLRDSFFVYMGLTYLVNIVDAYVDAHLFDFDVSETNNKKNYSLKLKIGL